MKTPAFPVVICCVLAVMVFGPSFSDAKVFHVEKDGSGDYTVIQDAVDAAASGDTIRIGEGRFDDKTWLTAPGWSEYVNVKVTQEVLTIIGSGPETIIGPDSPWDPTQGNPKGVVCSDLLGTERLILEDFCVENLRDGVYVSYEVAPNCSLVLSNCLFKNNSTSLWLLGRGADISILNSRFEYPVDSGDHIVGWEHENLLVEGCEFFLEGVYYGQTGISLNWVNDATISKCHFTMGHTAVAFHHSNSFEVRDSTFEDQTHYGISVIGEGGSGVVQGSTFRNNLYGLCHASQWYDLMCPTACLRKSGTRASL